MIVIFKIKDDQTQTDGRQEGEGLGTLSEKRGGIQQLQNSHGGEKYNVGNTVNNTRGNQGWGQVGTGNIKKKHSVKYTIIYPLCWTSEATHTIIEYKL